MRIEKLRPESPVIPSQVIPYHLRAARPRRQSDGVVREHAELYRLLVERVMDYAIFALDPDGYILNWNAGAERVKGYTADEAIGQHFSLFYPSERLTDGFPDHHLLVAAATGRFEDDGWRLRKDGSRFWANVVITALRDDTGELIGFAKITRDLTEQHAVLDRVLDDARRMTIEEAARRNAEQRAVEFQGLAERLREQAEALEARTEEAVAANEAKSAFLMAMSHELRTPLNAIGGYAELLQLGITGPVNPAQVEQLERIQRAQRHLLRIITDLLDFSRMNAAQLGYDIGPVDLSDAMESVAQMIAPLALKRCVRLVRNPCPSELVAQGDRSKVEQVLLNLLSNAIKFTPAGGQVSLECSQSGAHVAATVRDTGIGIAADMLEAVFRPFVQVGRSLTSGHEGTGLGLAISRELARAMNGELSVESTAKVGSTFTLTLPQG